MIWMSPKPAGVLDSACYALISDTERSTVPNTALDLLLILQPFLILGVVEETEAEEDVGKVASTVVKFVCV